MPSKKLRITIYLTPEEHTSIAASARRTRLSLSTFAKRVCLGNNIPSLECQEARLELRRLKGDLGRLGGLFKQCLVEGHCPPHELRQLLREIDERQREVQEAVGKIR